MNKKEGFILVIILLLAIINFVHADIVNFDSETGAGDVLGIDPDSIPQDEEEAAFMAKNYLYKKWGEILNNSKYTKPLFNFYYAHQTPIDYISKYLFGMTPSLSWLFVINLVLWGSLYVFIVRVFEVFEVLSKPVKYGLSFLFTWFLGAIKFLPLLSELLIKLVGKSESIWAQSVIIIAVIFFLLILDSFSAQIRDIIRDFKKKFKQRKLVNDVDKGKKDISVLKEEISNARDLAISTALKPKKKGLTQSEIDEIDEEAQEDAKSLWDDAN